MAFTETALSEEISDATDTIFTTEAVTELAESIADETFTINIALQETDDELSTFAATSNIPPPPRVEKGDCEKALNPNIISSVHYLITMQKEQLFQDQLSRKTF